LGGASDSNADANAIADSDGDATQAAPAAELPRQAQPPATLTSLACGDLALGAFAVA
jgi:hypothetical protein